MNNPTPQQYARLKFLYESNPSLTIFKELESVKSQLNAILEAQISQIRDDFSKVIDKELGTVIEKVVAVEKQVGPKGDRGDKGDKGNSIIGPVGPKGERGERGESIIGPVGPVGKSGYTPVRGLDYDDGKDGQSIVGPAGKDGKDGSPDTGAIIVDKVNALPIKWEYQIDASHIRNLPKLKERKIRRLGGGGGGLGTILTATGTIDDTNVTFTFTELPTVLVINGGMYRQTGGAITWTYLAGTVTLSVAVGVNGSIFGLV